MLSQKQLLTDGSSAMPAATLEARTDTLPEDKEIIEEEEEEEDA